MKDIFDKNEGFAGDRDSRYPTYIPGDAKIEGFCTFRELKARIERLEKMLEQVSDSMKITK